MLRLIDLTPFISRKVAMLHAALRVFTCSEQPPFWDYCAINIYTSELVCAHLIPSALPITYCPAHTPWSDQPSTSSEHKRIWSPLIMHLLQSSCCPSLSPCQEETEIKNLEVSDFPIESFLNDSERNAPWYMPNTVIRRDLQTSTVKKEICRYSSQYSARFSAHPNGLVVNLKEQPDNRS
jgi:hypothetical protein